MPKKLLILISILFLYPPIGFASDLVAASGGEVNNNSYKVFYSIGEPITKFSESSNYKFDFGFIQIVKAVSAEDMADSDSDGLDDAWEIQYFGNLLQGPLDDPDGDQITNIEEYQLGFDPTNGVTDNDGDALLDRWELDYFGNLDQAKEDDPDNDGISNQIEYLLGNNPTDPNSRPEPGIRYEYDKLGRFKTIIRIP